MNKKIDFDKKFTEWFFQFIIFNNLHQNLLITYLNLNLILYINKDQNYWDFLIDIPRIVLNVFFLSK